MIKLLFSLLTIWCVFFSHSYAHNPVGDYDVVSYDDYMYTWEDSTDNHDIHSAASSYSVANKSLTPYHVNNSAEVGLSAYGNVSADMFIDRTDPNTGLPVLVLTSGTYSLYAEVGYSGSSLDYDEPDSSFFWGGCSDSVNAYDYADPGHAGGFHDITEYYAQVGGSISITDGYSASSSASR